jgi:DNA (cytosine-5)-methyltransferase 1
MQVKQTILNEFSILREQSGLGIPAVAELCGATPRTVYRWENGEIKPGKLVLDKLRDHIPETEQSRRTGFTFIDLFAGIGGMRLAFESIGGQCVYTSEWDSHALKTYIANFPTSHRIDGDINQVKPEDIPHHNLLVAGFPCQPFSIAGVSKKNSLGRPHGFRDKTQGTLFFKVAEIIEHHRPDAFLLENVKNLKSHDQGRTFRVICETLQELGYYFDARIIDARHFVPQHRERIFIAGFKKNTGFSFDGLELPLNEETPLLGSILHREDGSELPDPPYTDGPEGLVNPKYTLTDKLWAYLQTYAKKHQARGNGFGFGLVGPENVARTLSARYYKDGSEILVRQPGRNPRRLTPRECARLMGFERYRRKFKIPVSDTQAYRQFGNSVVVPVIEAVAWHMLPHLLPEEYKPVERQLRFQYGFQESMMQ